MPQNPNRHAILQIILLEFLDPEPSKTKRTTSITDIAVANFSKVSVQITTSRDVRHPIEEE